jgi:hypothetical protein
MRRFVKVRGALTYANVMATAAVFIALGGSSYAALKVTSKDVRDNSLRSRDIRDNSVTSRDIRNGTLTPKDFKQATATANAHVLNRSNATLEIHLLVGQFASAPAVNSHLNPGDQQDFTVNAGNFAGISYKALNAAGEQIGNADVFFDNFSPPDARCSASGGTLPSGGTTWDGACTTDGFTATVTG